MKPIIFTGHSRPIKDLTFANNSEHLFSASSDRNVILWAAETGQKITTYQHTSAINSIKITSDSKLLITGDNTGTSYIWDVQAGNLLKKFENESLLLTKNLTLSQDSNKVALISSGRTKDSSSYVNIYNLLDMITFDFNSIESLEPLFRKESDKGQKYITSKFTKNDNLLYISREDGFIEVINVKDKDTTENLKQFHKSAIIDIDMSPNDDFIITASLDGSANLIEAKNFEIVKTFKPENPKRNVNTCKFLPSVQLNSEDFYRQNFHAVGYSWRSRIKKCNIN